MTNIIQQSFSLNLHILKALFLYSETPLTKLHKLRAYLVFCLFMFHVPILGTLYFIFAEDINMKRVSDNGYVLAEMCCYVPKLMPFITKASEIKKCINYFESPSFVTFRENHKIIMNRAGRVCKRNSLIFIICLNTGFVLWASKPCFTSEWKLPIDVFLPFDFSINLVIYYFSYSWIVLGAGFPAVASSAVEPLIAGLACLAAAHLRVLRDNLENMYEYSEEECGEEKSEKYRNRKIYRNIRQCIKHHQEILKFAKFYEDCFSQVVFSQFIGSIFVLGFCCLQISMVETFSVEFFSTLNYFAILLTQIYFYCYYGTSLHEESNALTKSVYMGKWYKYDPQSKKLLIILMERAKRPIVITAGKLLDLSLVTFTTILRRSYSVLAVLNNQ